MLLKLILNALLVYVVYRLLRGLFRPRPPRTPGGPASRRLDPDRAVPAEWSEVQEEEGERARD